MFVVRHEQQHNSVTKMIIGLRWKDLTDKKKDTRLTLFYRIVNRQVNIPSEVILIPVNGETRNIQADNTFMYIGLNIDNYTYSFY